jgi:hypothetical protein
MQFRYQKLLTLKKVSERDYQSACNWLARTKPVAFGEDSIINHREDLVSFCPIDQLEPKIPLSVLKVRSILTAS